MADFIPKAAVKSAVRKFSAPIENVTLYNELVQEILDNNPWACTSYTSGGATIAGVVKGKQTFTGAVIYEDGQAKTVGRISISAPSSAAFATDVSTIIATAALGTAMGGSPSHDSSDDNFSTNLKCHDANGENYSVSIRRDSITLSSYEAAEIAASLESWADTIGILA
jgi:hypothetical protein